MENIDFIIKDETYYIIEALKKLRPGAKWYGENEKIIWQDEKQTKPSDEELQAEINKIKELDIKEEKKLKYKRERENALNNITYTLNDGSVYQVRPKDVNNFKIAIERNQDIEWILADNTVRLTKPDELKEILNSGIEQAVKIWNNYIKQIKN